jgi:HK97 family phage prohead protease
MPLQFSHLIRRRESDQSLERERLNQRIVNALAQEERAALAYSTSPGLERRPAVGATVRAARSGKKKILEGYAARWNSLSSDLGGFKEELAAGCFSNSLKRGQVSMLFSHDAACVIASQRNNSLDLSEDSKGLRFRAQLNGTGAAEDAFENIENGEISGMSFGFQVLRDKWDEILDPGDDDDDENYSARGRNIKRRTVLAGNLLEISPVLWPAYSSSSVSAAARSAMLWPNGEPAQIAEIRSRYSVIPAGGMSAADEALLLQIRIQALKLENY